jgi:thiol-disulfide isomerase/thioredoxin
MYPCKKSIPIFAALLLATWPICAFAGLKEGDALPDLATFKLEGKLPEDMKGKVILLDFWASWCEPCKKSFPAMEELKKKYGDKGFIVLAVSVDEKKENMEKFLKSMNVSFTTLRDAEQKLVAAADVPTMPTSFLIDRTGKICHVHSGFKGEETTKQYAQEIEQLLKDPKP